MEPAIGVTKAEGPMIHQPEDVAGMPKISLALEICPSCFCDWTFNLIQGLQIGKNNVLFILIVNGCYALAS